MPYTDKEKTKLVNTICNWMEGGASLRSACLQESLPRKTFFEWIDGNEQWRNQYARACEARADKMFDEIIEIADDSSQDTIQVDLGGGVIVEKENHEFINRSKVRIDARKWSLAKMMPKKYGDKLDVTSDGEKIQNISHISLPDYLEKKK
jgi:hypothetical protein